MWRLWRHPLHDKQAAGAPPKCLPSHLCCLKSCPSVLHSAHIYPTCYRLHPRLLNAGCILCQHQWSVPWEDVIRTWCTSCLCANLSFTDRQPSLAEPKDGSRRLRRLERRYPLNHVGRFSSNALSGEFLPWEGEHLGQESRRSWRRANETLERLVHVHRRPLAESTSFCPL